MFLELERIDGEILHFGRRDFVDRFWRYTLAEFGCQASRRRRWRYGPFWNRVGDVLLPAGGRALTSAPAPYGEIRAAGRIVAVVIADPLRFPRVVDLDRGVE